MYNLQLAFYNFSLFIFCIYFFRVQNYDISPTYEILICMDFLPFRRHFSVFSIKNYHSKYHPLKST